MVSATTAGLLNTKPLHLPIRDGGLDLTVPVVLAPMAGITNSAFRLLCREQGAGLFVSEMVTARALTERNEETMRMIVPGVGETPRSIQLYATDPDDLERAVEMLGREDELTSLVTLRKGDAYSGERMNETTKKITERMGVFGYAFANGLDSA